MNCMMRMNRSVMMMFKKNLYLWQCLIIRASHRFVQIGHHWTTDFDNVSIGTGVIFLTNRFHGRIATLLLLWGRISVSGFDGNDGGDMRGRAWFVWGWGSGGGRYWRSGSSLTWGWSRSGGDWGGDQVWTVSSSPMNGGGGGRKFVTRGGRSTSFVFFGGIESFSLVSGFLVGPGRFQAIPIVFSPKKR